MLALLEIKHIGTKKLTQNGRSFANDILKRIFFKKKGFWISIEISPNFVPQDQINHVPALVQIITGETLYTTGQHAHSPAT